MTGIHLSASDVALAALLVLANGIASIVLRLRLHRALAVSAARMVVQLLLVGFLLRLLFAANSAIATSAVAAIMVLAAAREVAARPSRQLRRAGNYRISLFVVTATGIAAVTLTLLTAIRPQPWYDARYAIPLMGMVLGSILNSASLGLDAFMDGATGARAALEAQLSLGATVWQALSELLRTSIRRGMIPVINQMSAAGIITLPGIMTGQLLAGMDPIEAVKYQILLLFLLTGASGLASAGVVYLAARAITDDRHRLRLDRIT